MHFNHICYVSFLGKYLGALFAGLQECYKNNEVNAVTSFPNLL